MIRKQLEKILLLWSAASLVAVVVVCPAVAQIGFQAKLLTPPSQISYYDEVDAPFTVARGPRQHHYWLRALRHDPQPVRASYDRESITFGTTYYTRSGQDYDLVPVTVDQLAYLEYRKERRTREEFRDKLNKIISDPDAKRASKGVGFSIGLPKRFDRMFGEGGAGLVVEGSRRISFSGRSNWTEGAESGPYRQSRFPTLNMEQVSQFTITGTIGEKISVKVSQDSRTDIPLSNRIEIRYRGNDDDVLRSIEAGNTTLNLPNTRFVGYSSRIQGLFGLKAEAQVGPLHLVGIASQEKGTSERATVSPTGDGAASANDIRDYEYAENRIFDLGLYPPPSDLEDAGVAELEPGDSVLNLIIYQQIASTSDETDYLPANIYVHPDDTTIYSSESIVDIKVVEMDGDKYFWEHDENRVPYLIFTSAASRNRALGAWMVIKKQGSSVPDTIGTTIGETLKLKLIRHNTPAPGHVTWNQMWRNCYTIPLNTAADELELKIYYGLPGSEATSNIDETQEEGNSTQSYLEILGLDQYNARDDKIPDGLLDEVRDIYRSDIGLLIFPHRRPFDSDTTFVDSLADETQELKVKVPDIYDNTIYSEARISSSKYFIRMTSRTRSSIIRLSKPNIIEGSERVYLDGELLTRGTDYRIDYSFGQITLMSSKATDPNADLEIDYEYAPFLALQKKTLFGMRAEYAFSDDFSMGSTFLYKSDKAEDRKPRVGQETARTMVYDVDAELKLRPTFLTDMVDALPLVETEALSNLTLSGEVAQSLPNPNVDGVAYVDDFESAVDKNSLGISRVNWSKASKPAHVVDDLWVRGQVLWHQPDGGVNTDEVYDRDYGQGGGIIRTFRMIFRPDHWHRTVDTAALNQIPTDPDLIEDGTTIPYLPDSAGPYPSWGGIMRYFGNRVDAERVQALEVRMRGTKRGKLHFDFGQIIEDLDGDAASDDEDIDLNGTVDASEDLGLDLTADENEFGYHAALNPDPEGDNFWTETGGGANCPVPTTVGGCGSIDWLSSQRYEYLNGTEGNRDDIQALARPDAEELSSNGFARTDAYFAIEIDLEADSFLVEGSELNEWRTYRIPVKQGIEDTIQGNDVSVDPSWDEITYVRVWFEADEYQTEPDTIEVADWHFVQMNWQGKVVYSPLSPDSLSTLSTQFEVSSVSEEDKTFSAPAAAEAYTDPTTNVTEAQRGLELAFYNLNSLDSCLADKELFETDSYSGYGQMEMYVWGDTSGTMPVEEDGKLPIKFFYRLGQDTLNFYEYRTDVYEGWDSRNNVAFNFDSLTAFKDSLILLANELGTTEIDGVKGNYRVVGYPNLTEIIYFQAGVVSTRAADTVGGITGKIWLDEMRVTDVRRDKGIAARFSAAGSLADLLTYSFNYQYQDAYFRSVSAATRAGSDDNLGSGKNQTTYNYRVTLNMDRFLPRAWQASLPVTYSASKTDKLPLLRSGSDIVLSPETREAERETTTSQGFTFAESFKHKGRNLLFQILLNRQSVNYSYRRTISKTVNTPYSFSEATTVSSRLDLGIPKAPTLPILFWTKPLPIAKRLAGTQLGLYPTRWNLSATYDRNASITDDKTLTRRSSLKRTLTGQMDVAYNLFQSITMSYNAQTRRDLSDLDNVNLSFSNLKLGQETRFSESFKTGYRPVILPFLTTDLNYGATYADDWDRTNDLLSSSMSSTWGVSGTFDHRKLFGAKRGGGRGRGRGSRNNVRGGGTKAQAGRPLYDYPLGVMRFLTGWITPPNYSYSENYNSSLPGMTSRPGLKYQFGFTRNADVELSPQGRSPSASQGESYSAGSGFSLLGGITTDVNFRRSIDEDVLTQGTRQRSISTGWPDLTIRISSFRTLPLIKPFVNRLIQIFTPRTGFTRSTRETIDLDAGFTTARSESISQSPLLALNLNLLRKLTVKAQYDVSHEESEKYNPSDGSLDKETRSDKKGMSFDISYQFSAPGGIGIPIFGRVKFQSTVNIRTTFKINSSLSETRTKGGEFTPTTDKSDFTWSTEIKYNFSRQINGGMSTRWQDSNDSYQNRISHTREVRFYVELRF